MHDPSTPPNHGRYRSTPGRPSTSGRISTRWWASRGPPPTVGAQRFVLDDGWFAGRRNDHAGLGDWYVDGDVWPAGLGPLIAEVHALGMDFGLWVEPEMINLDSDLARAHPEWIFRAGGREGIRPDSNTSLSGHPEAYDYIAERLHDLLDTYEIAYLKWDHNRMVLEAGHGSEGAPGVHGTHSRCTDCWTNSSRGTQVWKSNPAPGRWSD